MLGAAARLIGLELLEQLELLLVLHGAACAFSSACGAAVFFFVFCFLCLLSVFSTDPVESPVFALPQRGSRSPQNTPVLEATALAIPSLRH